MEQLLNKTKGDKVIWSVVILLSLVSLLAVYSSTSSLAYRLQKGHAEIYLIKQLGVLAAGIIIVYLCHKINYMYYSKFALILFIISIPLLIYT
ncbi:MAG: FtsW/RodA/SpoVE family cell cycle protein, partial [Chitinophagaceae bacterium]|nr:FtsW/RodA/SpoVE family cell cycle protein [Chitinophagaceae bacterium]